jgi:Pyruvate/2-oxoacid:ferredoxin oxidoreductase gamma subunit
MDITHKDQDALNKTGYSYFMAKNYDLAARGIPVFTLIRILTEDM